MKGKFQKLIKKFQTILKILTKFRLKLHEVECFHEVEYTGGIFISVFQLSNNITD